MVSKRHAFGAEEARLVFELGGDLDFGQSGTNEGEDVVEELASQRVRPRPISASSSSSFTWRSGSTRGDGKTDEKGAAQVTRKGGFPTSKLGDGGQMGSKPALCASGLRGQPLDGGNRGSACRRSGPGRLALLPQPASCSGHR